MSFDLFNNNYVIDVTIFDEFFITVDENSLMSCINYNGEVLLENYEKIVYINDNVLSVQNNGKANLYDISLKKDILISQ